MQPLFAGFELAAAGLLHGTGGRFLFLLTGSFDRMQYIAATCSMVFDSGRHNECQHRDPDLGSSRSGEIDFLRPRPLALWNPNGQAASSRVDRMDIPNIKQNKSAGPTFCDPH